jgi:hypothetical protein
MLGLSAGFLMSRLYRLPWFPGQGYEHAAGMVYEGGKRTLTWPINTVSVTEIFVDDSKADGLSSYELIIDAGGEGQCKFVCTRRAFGISAEIVIGPDEVAQAKAQLYARETLRVIFPNVGIHYIDDDWDGFWDKVVFVKNGVTTSSYANNNSGHSDRHVVLIPPLDEEVPNLLGDS